MLGQPSRDLINLPESANVGLARNNNRGTASTAIPL
jgi:hypothetical protein